MTKNKRFKAILDSKYPQNTTVLGLGMALKFNGGVYEFNEEYIAKFLSKHSAITRIEDFGVVDDVPTLEPSELDVDNYDNEEEVEETEEEEEEATENTDPVVDEDIDTVDTETKEEKVYTKEELLTLHEKLGNWKLVSEETGLSYKAMKEIRDN